MKNEIKAIETYYRGHRFRSRLEARWAVFFDHLGIRWVYEPEGLYINGVCYLPDFYLPDSHQFFEVKGVLTDADEKKVQALISAGYSVTIGYDNGIFVACNRWEDLDGNVHYELSDAESSVLARCFDCGKFWFMGEIGAFTCQCCGAYDGDHHYVVFMDNSTVTSEWDVARKARFEHNETPQVDNALTHSILQDNYDKKYKYNRMLELRFCIENKQNDIAFGGYENFTFQNVAKTNYHTWLKRKGKPIPEDEWLRITTITNYFRDRRIERVLYLKSRGAEVEDIVRLTKLKREWIEKYYYDEQRAKDVIGSNEYTEGYYYGET